MYSINNIALSAFGVIPGRADGSNIALSGMLDMPKRMGKTFHNWDDEPGVEPYVSAAEIAFEGRNLIFHGYLYGNNKRDALNRVASLYSHLTAFSDVVPLSTPWGNYRVYVKDEIVSEYLGQGWVQLRITFREPVVTTSNMIPSGTSEDIYNIDGVALSSLGAFVTKVSGNFYSPQRKQSQFTSYGKEGYQITKLESMLIDTETIFYADNYQILSENVQKLHTLLASPGTRKLNVDGKIRECFNIQGFTVENIKVANNMALCKLNFQMMTARDGDPINTGYLLDNKHNNIVSNLNKLITI